MSLPSELLCEFDKSMVKSGFRYRSKAIQTALHSFIAQNNWEMEDEETGAGAIMVPYNKHKFNQDTKSIQTQHKYTDVISAATHMHLDRENCLEI
jgi:CopG family nickel-responsive transcriptional regulator